MQPWCLRAVTTCELESDDGRVTARGFAFCSVRDQFSRARGRAIAKGRAAKVLAERVAQLPEMRAAAEEVQK